MSDSQSNGSAMNYVGVNDGVVAACDAVEFWLNGCDTEVFVDSCLGCSTSSIISETSDSYGVPDGVALEISGNSSVVWDDGGMSPPNIEVENDCFNNTAYGKNDLVVDGTDVLSDFYLDIENDFEVNEDRDLFSSDSKIDIVVPQLTLFHSKSDLDEDPMTPITSSIIGSPTILEQTRIMSSSPDKTPLVTECNTPILPVIGNQVNTTLPLDIFTDFNENSGSFCNISPPHSDTTTFIFTCYFEFIAYYFVYILAIRIILHIVIVSNDEDVNEFSNYSPGDFSITSNCSVYSLEPALDSDENHSDQIPYDQLLSQTLPEVNDDCNHQETPSNFLQSLRVKNVDRILIGHLNVNSIPNKIELVGDLIQGRIDIFLISETKINKSFPTAQFEINGFFPPHRLDRTIHGGGLLLYVRNDITTKPLSLIQDGIECIIIEVTISKKKWLVMGIYNPQKSLSSSFLTTLSKNIDHYLPKYDNLVLLGDFNCEMSELCMEEFCLLYDLKSLIKKPTCFKSDSNPSCIDLILTNRVNSFQNSLTVETGISDFHHLVVTVLKTKFKKKPPIIKKYREFKNYNSFNYLNHVNMFLAGKDLHQMPHDIFANSLTCILDEHAPIKTKYVRGNEQPFMTKELRKEHMKRTRLLNKYRKNKNGENENAYKKQRNLCTKLLKKTKATYYGNLKPSNVTDNKKFWKNVKPLFSDKCVSADNITLIEKTGVLKEEIISDDKTLANIFNTFFNGAVKSLNIDYYEHFSFDCIYSESEDPIIKAIEKYSKHPSIQKIKEHYPKNSKFSFQPTNLENVRKEVKNLDVSKSAPIESLPARVIKDIADTFCPKMVIDFNTAIKSGIFPDTPKHADVVPVFKKGVRQSKGNYRPVSLLSAISKLFGRLMLHQMHEYMQKIISIFICGYTKGMNAQNCLVFMVEFCKKALDRGQKFGVLLTDLSKAFDCLVHDLLIAKLDAYGFDYLSLKLIFSYLSGRKQRVRINASYSEYAYMETGVPQGSILGPELYNYNSNDLFLFLLLQIANYADDNSPFCTAQSIPQVINNLEADANNLLSWIKYNGLKANPDKFHLILSDIDQSISMKVDKFDISNSLHEELLGITVDNKLNFKAHVTELCTIASQKLHALSRVSYYMDFIQRKIIMNSYILAQFGYCLLVWMFYSRGLNNRINKIHKRALRIVYRDDKSSFETLLEKDKSFTIHERAIQKLCIELYKVAYGISPKIMRLVFPTKPEVKYPWENIFQTFNVRTVAWGTESLSHLGPKIWSLIPLEFKKIPTLPKFKNAIRNWKPSKCPCRLCKYYLASVGFITVSN